jgi:hypothetical protein
MLATLSAGPVAIGDALGNIAGGNVLRAVRPDGVIVKPDVAITPTDDTFIADAQGIDVPMVASTFSDLGNGVRGIYFFAYARAANTSFTLNPSTYGITGAAWLYRYTAGTGQLIQPNASVTLDVTTTAELFVLMPVGRAGIAFLGDKGHFVSLGRKRISDFVDGARLEVEIQFAPGEKNRTVFGYSPKAVAVMSMTGGHSGLSWDPATQMFSVVVHPGKEGTARIRMIHSSASGGGNHSAN